MFFASGAAALGFQLVWTQMFAAGLGHETPAMLAVVTAFFGGMAAGAWLLDRRISTSRDPRRWFARLQFVIGGWAVLLTLCLPSLNEAAVGWIGSDAAPFRQAWISFAFPFFALLPATAAMGATLPAMAHWLASQAGEERALARVYAWNTAGAAVGTLSAVAILAPVMGFFWTAMLLAALNLLSGWLAWHSRVSTASGGGADAAAASMSRSLNRSAGLRPGALGIEKLPGRRPALRGGASATGEAECRGDFSPGRLLGTAFGCGLLGIGFEILGVRVLSQAMENTVYTFASALAVYLVGTALGAWAYQRLRVTQPFRPLLGRFLCALGAACLVETWMMTRAPAFYEALRSGLGGGLPAVLASEFTVALSVFLIPTIFMGMLFSHLIGAAVGRGGGIGRASAMNTLGGALAGVVFGVLWLPAIGAKWLLVAVAAGYLLLMPTLRGGLWAGVVVCLGLVFVLPADLRLIQLPAGATVLDYREGIMASVVVLETPDGQRSLRVNNRFQMGGTSAALAERRQAHLPLLLHAHPRRALFLGLGTGITLGAATEHPGLVADGVELIPEVIEVMRLFAPENRGVAGDNPNLKRGSLRDAGRGSASATNSVHLIAADARRFVRASRESYDVIVADLFHPARDGAGFLYTREHFEAVRQRLAPGGLFCQWLPLHQLDETTLRIIVRTFLEVFSHTEGFLLHFNTDVPALALVGTLDPMKLTGDWLEHRAAEPVFRQAMKQSGFDRTLALLGCHLAGPRALADFSAAAPLNTDNFPRVAFGAPRFASHADMRRDALLLALLERFSEDSRVFVAAGPDAGLFGTRLREFIAARDLYLRGLAVETDSELSKAIDLYLESSRRSLYFTASYARLVNIIQVMAAADRESARRLFGRLQEAQPGQPLGQQLLGPLFSEP